MKEETLLLIPRNTKNRKILLRTMKCQQIGQPKRNGYIHRKIQPT